MSDRQNKQESDIEAVINEPDTTDRSDKPNSLRAQETLEEIKADDSKNLKRIPEDFQLTDEEDGLWRYFLDSAFDEIFYYYARTNAHNCSFFKHMREFLSHPLEEHDETEIIAFLQHCCGFVAEEFGVEAPVLSILNTDDYAGAYEHYDKNGFSNKIYISRSSLQEIRYPEGVFQLISHEMGHAVPDQLAMKEYNGEHEPGYLSELLMKHAKSLLGDEYAKLSTQLMEEIKQGSDEALIAYKALLGERLAEAFMYHFIGAMISSMWYVQSNSLRERLDRGLSNIKEALEFFSQLAIQHNLDFNKELSEKILTTKSCSEKIFEEVRMEDLNSYLEFLHQLMDDTSEIWGQLTEEQCEQHTYMIEIRLVPLLAYINRLNEDVFNKSSSA
jgi:hypothetical protein